MAVTAQDEAGTRRLSILAPNGYPWSFNGPRQSRHGIRRSYYAPLNKLRSNLDGATLFNPLHAGRADLIHAFNRIPFNRKPYVIGFESHLPRVFGLERSWYEKLLFSALRSERCRRIVAISDYAARGFRRGLAEAGIGTDARSELEAKLTRRYPNLPVGEEWGADMDVGTPWVLTFVGNHFARKGGCTAVRIAELCLERGLEVEVNIVSSLQCGGPIWTDPEPAEAFADYLALLDLPNVNHLSNLPNEAVRALLARSHFSILTTFGDTFGFSALEAMSVGTPVIATAQGALPEVIEDDVSGILLDAAITPGTDGWIWPYAQRSAPQFVALFRQHVERMARESVERIAAVLSERGRYRAMRRAAHGRVQTAFDSLDASAYWDSLYCEVLS
jgi:glycosyltransferase involved in cell wall biosynthesis